MTRRNRLGVAALGAASLVAAGLAAPLSSTADPGHSAGPVTVRGVLALVAPDVVRAEVYEGEEGVWFEPGVQLVAGADPLEFISRRPSYTQPITTTWRAGSRTGTVPAGTQKDFSGLTDFAVLKVTTKGGKVLRKRKVSACINGWETQRIRPDAPAMSPYPRNGCPMNPFTIASVQGIQGGWSTPFTTNMEKPFTLKPGRYKLVTQIRAPWSTSLGLSAAERRVTSRLVVRKGQAEERRDAGRTSTSPDLVPNATEPTRRQAGSDGPRPDLRSLPAFQISLNRKKTHLRFAATVWNAGDSPLVVDGYRGRGEDHMDAYQYFFDTDGEQVGYQQVGQLHFHGKNHQHWHFEDFARYRLLKADKSQAAKSGKVSFCLANTDAVDYTVPGADWNPDGTDLATACGSPGSLAIREVLSSGSGDTYAQFRAGQAFNLKGLKKGWYWIAVEANPMGNLVEQDKTNNVSLRKVWIGGKQGKRKIKVPPIGQIDESMTGNW